jgi:hypothetical protein
MTLLRFPFFSVKVLGWGCVLLCAGCQSRPTVKSIPVVVTVPHFEHMDVSSCQGRIEDINLLLSTRAEAFAKTIENGNVWYGDGLSMEPILKPGSWLVTHPQAFRDLEPGMLVLYTSSVGRPVAHALLRRTSRGWIVAGINNRRVDADLVTSDNLAGVITAVFAPQE